jgi:hypothetical protein
MFGPAIPADGKFSKNKAFVDFLLTKIINAENAAHRFLRTKYIYAPQYLGTKDIQAHRNFYVQASQNLDIKDI